MLLRAAGCATGIPRGAQWSEYSAGFGKHVEQQQCPRALDTTQAVIAATFQPRETNVVIADAGEPAFRKRDG